MKVIGTVTVSICCLLIIAGPGAGYARFNRVAGESLEFSSSFASRPRLGFKFMFLLAWKLRLVAHELHDRQFEYMGASALQAQLRRPGWQLAI